MKTTFFLRNVFAFSAVFGMALTARADALKYHVDSSFFYLTQAAKAADGTTPVVSFSAVNGAYLPSANSTDVSHFVLGNIVVVKPASGQTATYSDTPFHLEVRVPELDTVKNPTPTDFWWYSNRNTISVDGKINGQVVGGSMSHLNVSVDSIKLGSYGPYIPEEKATYHFPIALSRLGIDPLAIAPNALSGSESFTLSMNVAPVPEPAAFVAFGLLGLWLVKRSRRK